MLTVMLFLFKIKGFVKRWFTDIYIVTTERRLCLCKDRQKIKVQTLVC